MRTNVIVTLKVEGTHNWPAAKSIFPEVAFLSDTHRHTFDITCKKKVNHDDRDVEFIMFKRDILDYIEINYLDTTLRTHSFGMRSCEMIAKELVEQFDLEYCSVFEDNENGAEVYK